MLLHAEGITCSHGSAKQHLQPYWCAHNAAMHTSVKGSKPTSGQQHSNMCGEPCSGPYCCSWYCCSVTYFRCRHALEPICPTDTATMLTVTCNHVIKPACTAQHSTASNPLTLPLLIACRHTDAAADPPAHRPCRGCTPHPAPAPALWARPAAGCSTLCSHPACRHLLLRRLGAAPALDVPAAQAGAACGRAAVQGGLSRGGEGQDTAGAWVQDTAART